jgi:lipoate-protein ligase A
MTRHGECHTPNGRTAAVALTVADGRVRAARVSGDFAVCPPDAAEPTLAAVAAALDGLPADAAVAAVAARVRAAVPFGVELVGTSPEAVAVAVVRAVAGDPVNPLPDPPAPDRVGAFTAAEIDRITDGWTRLPWRLIPERPLMPAVNVALDEVLADAAVAGGPPVLRFWRWAAPAVVIGRCQSVANEIDADAAAALGVQVVRRTTGGGAMFVQPHGAITYSLVLPESAVAGLTIRQSYEACDGWAVRALRDLGVDAHHVPVNDIACSDGKIGGAAQARRRGVVLHHTTLAYDMDPADMARVLRIGRPRLRERAVASAAKKVSPLALQTERSREEVAALLFEAFRRRYGGTVGELTADELAAADRLAADKYATPGWTQEFE